MDTLQLELGTIFKIISPTNPELHNGVFIVKFINDTIIDIINTDSFENHTINIRNGTLSDESIQAIEIYDIPEEKGYAKQNGLVTDVWINVHIGGDLPAILTGRIVNTEQDSIEIELWDTKDHIFIDFKYEGIPKDLPITKIVIRAAPEGFKKQLPDVEEEDTETEDKPAVTETVIAESKTPETFEETKDAEITPTPSTETPTEPIEMQPSVQIEDDSILVPDNRQLLKDILVQADEIQFGEDLGELDMQVEVSDEEKRYSLQTQLNDLLDDLLSTVPDKERTQQTLNLIDRKLLYFKQLREKFSNFDDNCFIQSFKKNGYNHKPLLKDLFNLSKDLKTILPVVKHKQILLEANDDDYKSRQEQIDESEETTNVVRTLPPDDFIETLHTNANIYYGNEETVNNKFYDYVSTFQNDFKSFADPIDRELTFDKPIIVKNTIHTLINNISDDFVNFYNTVVKEKEVQLQRFVIQRYDLGINKLHTSKVNSYGMQYEIEEAVSADKAYTQSLLMMPSKQIISLSNCSKSNNIYENTQKSVNVPQYWAFFRKMTSIVTQEIDISSNMEELYDFTKIQHFISNGEFDSYEAFLQHILPTTRYILENVIEEDSLNNTSYNEVLKRLEPFGITRNDLIFSDHKIIIDIIEKNIQKIRISLAEEKKRHARLKKMGNQSTKSFYDFVQTTNLKNTTYIEDSEVNLTDMQDKYNIMSSTTDSFGNTHYLQTSEALTRTQKADNNILFYRFVNLANKMLYSNTNIEGIVKEAISGKEKELETSVSECKTKTLVKEYYSIEELEADNQQEISYDKKFDNTNYMIIEEYEAEQQSMVEDEFLEFLTEKLQENIGLTHEKAKNDAQSMIRGSRIVEEGDYAVLILDEDSGNPGRFYYTRAENVWKYDGDLTKTISQTKDESSFCNIKPKCLSLRKSCEDIDDIKNHSQKSSMEKILKSVEETFAKDHEKLKAMFPLLIKKDYEYLSLRLKYLLFKLTNTSQLKYNFGLKAELMETIHSPYEPLLTRILGIQDHVSKYQYLTRFVEKLTRPPVVELDEDGYWLYCKNTDVKLIPSFYKDLCVVAYNPVLFQEELVRITDERGALSDAGDKYVDKYSGYEIRRIEFNDEQGYDEAGYKINTYSTVTDDLTLQVENVKTDSAKNLFYKRLENIFLSLVQQLNIPLLESKEFVIQNVIQDVTSQLGNREQTIKSMTERKKIQKYEKQHNILTMTFFALYILIAIQTNIPSIKKSRAIPGCKVSFSGFPYETEHGIEGLTYIICALQTMANDHVEPWKNITKRKYSPEKFKENAIKLYESIVEHKADVQERLRMKANAIEEGKDVSEIIPEELSIKEWSRFMPYLQKIKMAPPKILPESFKKSLMDYMSGENKKQHIAFNLLHDKQRTIMNYILMLIENTLSSEELFLYGKNGMYFLENTCCLDNEKKATYNYVVSKEKRIHDMNKIVKHYTKLYYEMLKYDTPSHLLTLVPTKLNYPQVNQEYSTETIYRSFINLCNFNTNLHTPEYLKIFTQDKDFNLSDLNSITEKINKLQSSGLEFSPEQHTLLMKLVSKKRSIPNVYTEPLKQSQIINITQTLKSIYDDAESIIPKEFISKLTNVVLSYDKLYSETMPENVKKLYDYIKLENESMIALTKESVNEYLGGTSSENRKKVKFMEKTLETIEEFSKIDASTTTSAENTDMKSIQFINNMLYQICILLPIKITTNTFETEEFNPIPREVRKKLSTSHIMNLKNKLYTGYDLMFKNIKTHVTEISYPTINELHKQLKPLYTISKLLPFILDINSKSSPINVEIVKEVNAHMLLLALYQFSDFERVDLVLREETPSSDEEIERIEKESRSVLLRREKAHLIIELLKFITLIKETTGYNNEDIRLSVQKLVDKEKELTTGDLQAMTRDQREADRHFKIMGAGKYAIGLQKGLYEYDPSRYEFEQAEISRQVQNEYEASGMVSEAMRLYQNSDNLEDIESRLRAEEIERAEYDISHIQGEDGDNMEYDEY